MKAATKRWTKVLLIVLVLVAVVAGTWVYGSMPTVAAKRILSHAELARLPESACALKAWEWSSPFSGEEFLKFRASPEDIEHFLSSSPILKDVKCEHYSAQRMRLPFPPPNALREEHFSGPHEFFHPSPSAPDWYIERLKGPGRRYKIQPEGYHCPCEVIIDDETGTVFVKLMFS